MERNHFKGRIFKIKLTLIKIIKIWKYYKFKKEEKWTTRNHLFYI